MYYLIYWLVNDETSGLRVENCDSETSCKRQLLGHFIIYKDTRCITNPFWAVTPSLILKKEKLCSHSHEPYVHMSLLMVSNYFIKWSCVSRIWETPYLKKWKWIWHTRGSTLKRFWNFHISIQKFIELIMIITFLHFLWIPRKLFINFPLRFSISITVSQCYIWHKFLGLHIPCQCPISEPSKHQDSLGY